VITPMATLPGAAIGPFGRRRITPAMDPVKSN
jgi:hypothetical protein